MTYNPKTHLLRPLELGEIINKGDLFISGVDGLLHELTSSYQTGGPYNPHKRLGVFRPVPVTHGWHPRSEAHLLKDLPSKAKALWRNIDSLYGDMVFDASTETGAGWTAFLIIPPCDLPPPDPERERFEKWAKDSAISTKMEDGKYTGTFTAVAWSAWQAAARKELV